MVFGAAKVCSRAAICGVMPLTSLYLVWQVRLMQKYRLPEPQKIRT